MENVGWTDVLWGIGMCVFIVVFGFVIWADMTGRIERWTTEFNEELDKVEDDSK